MVFGPPAPPRRLKSPPPSRNTDASMMVRFLLFALAVVLVGCGGRAVQQPQQPSQQLVRIDWYGYQCFRIKSSLGLSILTNPFSPGSTSYKQPQNLQPEVLLVTAEESDLNYIDMAQNTPHIFRGSVAIGTNTAVGIRILGVPIFANPEVQSAGDMDIIYRWSMDGLKFCFLGELDRLPSPQELAKIGRVDVLFVPVSGCDLSSADRNTIIQTLGPQIIIPMGSYSAMTRFASGFRSVYRLTGPAALVSKATLPAQPTVLLFREP